MTMNHRQWLRMLDSFSVEELVEELQKEEREMEEVDSYPAWVDKSEIRKAIQSNILDIQYMICKKSGGNSYTMKDASLAHLLIDG